jgi:hypothetical protein
MEASFFCVTLIPLLTKFFDFFITFEGERLWLACQRNLSIRLAQDALRNSPAHGRPRIPGRR